VKRVADAGNGRVLYTEARNHEDLKKDRGFPPPYSSIRHCSGGMATVKPMTMASTAG